MRALQTYRWLVGLLGMPAPCRPSILVDLSFETSLCEGKGKKQRTRRKTLGASENQQQTQSMHLWHQVEIEAGQHLRRGLSPLRHPCYPRFQFSSKKIAPLKWKNCFGNAYLLLTSVAMTVQCRLSSETIGLLCAFGLLKTSSSLPTSTFKRAVDVLISNVYIELNFGLN